MPSRASVTSILDRELSSQAAGNDPLNPAPLSGAMLTKMHAYWRAANYLSVAQIYLQDNPLLDLSLRLDCEVRFGHFNCLLGRLGDLVISGICRCNGRLEEVNETFGARWRVFGHQVER